MGGEGSLRPRVASCMSPPAPAPLRIRGARTQLLHSLRVPVRGGVACHFAPLPQTSTSDKTLRADTSRNRSPASDRSVLTVHCLGSLRSGFLDHVSRPHLFHHCSPMFRVPRQRPLIRLIFRVRVAETSSSRSPFSLSFVLPANPLCMPGDKSIAPFR